MEPEPAYPAAVPAPISVNDGQKELAAITVASRIPEFWCDQPRLWFVQADAVLAPQKLSDEAKYQLVISKLGKEVIKQVSDILLAPPLAEKTKALRDRLLSIYEESESRQVQKLLSEMDLGDQKPSQLLRRMQELARNKMTAETLKVLWTGHLPATVRGILAVCEVKNLDQLAVIADKVIETTGFPHQVSEIKAEAKSEPKDLALEIAKLNAKVDRMNRGWNRERARSRADSRNRSNSKARITPSDPKWLCFYHLRFKDKANKCVHPCNWKKTSSEGN